MKRSFIRIMMTLMVVSFLAIRCGSASNLLSSGSSLMKALGSNANLSTITNLMQTPGLSKVLGGALKDPFTLLAPSNDAFAALGSDALSNLTKPENINNLAGLLKNHILPGKKDSASLASGALKSAAGNDLNLGGVNLGNMISGDDFNIIPVDKVLQQP